MRKILLLNGPNLDMLGIREPEVYGNETLKSLQEKVASYAYQHDALLTCFQSNSESALIDEIHRADGAYDGIVYNPGAHTHYSYALRDAIGSIDVPVVEVHISDIDAREPFRKVSVIAPACVAQVKGLGFDGYCRAIDVLCERSGLGRLGEGYEKRFPEGLNIIVAGGDVENGALPAKVEAKAPEVAEKAGSPVPMPASAPESAAASMPAEVPMGQSVLAEIAVGQPDTVGMSAGQQAAAEVQTGQPAPTVDRQSSAMSELAQLAAEIQQSPQPAPHTMEMPQPLSPQPVELQQAELQPAASHPAFRPVELQPTAVQPAGLQPTAVQPAGLRPVDPQPVAVRPAELQPATVQPAGLRSAEVRPITLHPVAIQPQVVQPSCLPQFFSKAGNASSVYQGSEVEQCSSADAMSDRSADAVPARGADAAQLRAVDATAACNTDADATLARDAATMPAQDVAAAQAQDVAAAPAQGVAAAPIQDTAAASVQAAAVAQAKDADDAAARSADVAQDFTIPFGQEIAVVDSGSVSRGRQKLVRATCERIGVGAILVRDTSNIRWITAFDGVFDEERAHALLVTDKVFALHTDSRYSNAIRTVAQRISSDITVNEDRVSHAEFAKSELAAAGFTGRLGIEDTITYAEFVKLAEAFGVSSLAATTDVVSGLRAVKSAAEISRMRAAQAVTDAAFRHIVGFMRPGMTEREVQLELDDFMLRHGAEGLAFSSIVATGANGADPHAIPGCTRLEAGQCVVMDFGAKAFGYCSDMTRTVFLGQPDARMASAWEVLRRANETVEAMLRPGVTGKQAHEAAENVLAEGGFAGKMGHGLGHGVGLDVHELPVLNTRNEAPLVAGNVVTVEPGIYLPGEFGMRLEDCGVVTPAGYHPFSQLGHDMVVL